MGSGFAGARGGLGDRVAALAFPAQRHELAVDLFDPPAGGVATSEPHRTEEALPRLAIQLVLANAGPESHTFDAEPTASLRTRGRLLATPRRSG